MHAKSTQSALADNTARVERAELRVDAAKVWNVTRRILTLDDASFVSHSAAAPGYAPCGRDNNASICF